MQLGEKIGKFSTACENLIAMVAIHHRPLTEEEVLLIRYYCSELLEKLPPPPKTRPRLV